MTSYTFRLANLQSDAPRMLPEPLHAGALFMSTSNDMTKDIEAFFDGRGISITRRRNLWMTMIWDERLGEHAIAQAAYSWLDGKVIREGLYVHPDYTAMNFDSFMDGMGSALFGGQAVSLPQAISP